MRKKRHLYAAMGCLAAAAVVLPVVTAQADDPQRVPLGGMETRSGDVVRKGTDNGPTDPASPVTAQVFLAGDTKGLADYARAVSDPANPSYGHYLTPEDTRGRFGPTQRRIDAVSEWLRGTGLSIDSATPRAVVVHGTAAQAASAFGTHFENYTYYSTPYRATTSPITVPAAVAPDILTVTGLTMPTGPRRKPGPPPQPTPGTPSANTTNDTGKRAAKNLAAQAGKPRNPCPAYYGDTPATDLPPAYGHPVQWAPCGYTPQQMRDAYGVTGTGLTGKGVTIGIIGISNEINILPDANRFSTEHGEPAFAPGQFTAYVPADARPEPVSGEEAMDVQGAHAMAPDANIAFVVGSRASLGDDVLDAVVQIVDRHLADVVSGSIITGYTPGAAPEAIAAYERVFQEAAVEGIALNFASGDSGGGLIDGVPTVEYPGSSPWVTSVGGTSLAIGEQNSYLWEIGWANDKSELSADGTRWDPEPPGDQSKASGGGTSTVFPQPFYQNGVVPASFAGTPPMRTVPDVSASADPELNLFIGVTQADRNGNLAYTVENGGGTSLASPLFTGIEALLVQEHGPIGFANPALYARHGGENYHRILGNPVGTKDTVAYATMFHDQIELVTPGQFADSNLKFAPGYNTTTGLGSPTRQLIDSFRPKR
ncbi:S53 family peptidase [Amycolatopsis pigmentata]|uniref:Protease pro-enzyme activation domain-containing protein n=1 Tax=Amycolatopsis pigmentata TaxID=450801 RepID=A0ABW5G264_9PSEU